MASSKEAPSISQSNVTSTPPTEQKQNETPPGWFQHERIIQSRISKEDFRRIADARRDIWNGGILGAIAGLTGAYVGQLLYRNIMQPKWWKSKHTTTVILIGGAFSSTLGAIFRGTGVSEHISDIWLRYRKPREYQSKLEHDQTNHHIEEIKERDKLIAHLSSKTNPNNENSTIQYDNDPFANNSHKNKSTTVYR